MKLKLAPVSFCIIALAVTAQARAALHQPVKIDSGLIQGEASSSNGIKVFKGVPYAKAPVGERRWRPPAPVDAWTGTLHANHFAPDCPTAMPLPESTAGSQSEDCLYMNIWTPAQKASDKLPVMVWIYGSGFQGASASYPRYDGNGLASKGVILVSFDYRNGILGFMTHPLLSSESARGVSGNYGLLDVLAAIQWVQHNIAAFGGDPRRITIFGQSSGSETVNIMTATPLARGLFQRAIGESGGSFGQREPKTLAQSEADGIAFAATLGASTLSELRAKTSAELFAAKPPRFEPVIDGWLLPQDVHAIYSKGLQNDVATLVGCNADEAQLSSTLTASQFESQVRGRYGARANEFFVFFPVTNDDDARLASKASGGILFGDFNTSVWAQLQAAHGHSKAYQYRFVQAPPASLDSSAPRRNGAFHGAEIPYVFDDLNADPRPWSDLDRRLAGEMSSYWVNFARSGDPNGPGLPHWPSLQENPRQVLELGENSRLIARPSTRQIEFFESVFYGPDGLFSRPPFLLRN